MQHRKPPHQNRWDLPGYGTVWYDPKAIANILSLRRVRDHYHITYDSSHRRFTLPSRQERSSRSTSLKVGCITLTQPINRVNRGKDTSSQSTWSRTTKRTLRITTTSKPSGLRSCRSKLGVLRTRT